MLEPHEIIKQAMNDVHSTIEELITKSEAINETELACYFLNNKDIPLFENLSEEEIEQIAKNTWKLYMIINYYKIIRE